MLRELDTGSEAPDVVLYAVQLRLPTWSMGMQPS